jgi:hypothetical protein
VGAGLTYVDQAEQPFFSHLREKCLVFPVQCPSACFDNLNARASTFLLVIWWGRAQLIAFVRVRVVRLGRLLRCRTRVCPPPRDRERYECSRTGAACCACELHVHLRSANVDAGAVLSHASHSPCGTCRLVEEAAQPARRARLPSQLIKTRQAPA